MGQEPQVSLEEGPALAEEPGPWNREGLEMEGLAAGLGTREPVPWGQRGL